MSFRTVLPLALALVACSTNVDSDGDGLTDAEEAELGTSPVLADTDGDGLSDGDEVHRLGFDPTVDRLRFNPLVADQPDLELVITSAPALTVFGTSTTGESMSFGVSNTSETASSYTTSSSYAVANSAENTTEWGTESEISASLTDFGASTSYSYGESTTTGRETTVSYGSDYTTESRSAAEQSREMASYGEVTLESAALAVNVDIVNSGDLAYTIASLTLSAQHRDLVDPSLETPIGSLLSADLEGGAGLSQAPGDRFSNVVFTNDGLSWEQGLDLLQDPSGLVLSVSSYELLDADGRAYALNGTDLQARTAEVVIDFGPEREPMRARVATNARVDANGRPLGITVRDALGDILGLDNDFNSEGLELEGLRTVLADREAWKMVSTSVEAQEGKGADHWVLRAGDVLELVWLDDSDDDGLFSREEAVLGTSNDDADSDADGLDDFEEARIVLSDPTVADTDGDGLLDGAEITGGTDALDADTDGDWLDDSEDAAPLVPAEMVDRTALWTFDGHLDADREVLSDLAISLDDTEFTADRNGRESAVLLSEDGRLDVDHPCRVDAGSFGAAYTAGFSTWVRIDTLPTDTDKVVACTNMDIEIDASGELTLYADGAFVGSLGQVELGTWTHLTVVGEGTLSQSHFSAWRDAAPVVIDDTTLFPALSYNNWVQAGVNDAVFALDQLSMLGARPTDTQVRQLMNEAGF